MNVRKLFLIVILGILLTACGVKNSDAIIGKWQSDRTGFVEFADNNVYRVNAPDGPTFEGTYKFTDSNTVEISVPEEFGGLYSVDVNISGDTLTFTATDGSSSAPLTRVK